MSDFKINPFTGEFDSQRDDASLKEVIAHADLTDMDATVHDARYYTETEIGATTGAGLVGYDNTQALVPLSATNVQDAIDEIQDEVAVIDYPADTITTTTGTNTAGNVDSVNTIDDADTYNVDEVSGGMEIRTTYINVVEFNKIRLHASYDGNPSHVVRVDLDKTPFNWTSFDTVLADYTDKTGVLTFYDIDVSNGNNYINSGTVRARIFHDSPGTPSHDHTVDLFTLRKGSTFGSGGVTSHGALDSLQDDDHDEIYPVVYRPTALTDTAINTAITNANAIGGGIVYLKEGTYVIDTGITMASNVILQGVGEGTMLVFSAVDNETLKGINISSSDNCIVKDLVIDGDKASQAGTAEHRGINIEDSDNVKLLNVNIKDIMGETSGLYGDGVFLGGTTVDNLLVDGCKITGCADDGIDTGNSGTSVSYARIVNSYFEDIVDNGIDTEGIAHSIISNNTFKDCAGNAIEIEQEYTSPTHCLHNTVSSNNISNATKGTADGIVLSSAKFTSVVGNIIENCVNGVQILTGNGINYSLSNTIIGNSIEGCTTGVDEDDSNQDYNYISGNMMSNNTADYDIKGINTILLSTDGNVLTLNQDMAVEGNLDADTITNRSQEISPASDIPALVLNRGTDSSPASDILKVYKNDGSTLLMSIQQDGRLYVASASASPTIVTSTGAGTTGSATLVGTDSAGKIDITASGTISGSNALIATITFSRAFNNEPAVSLQCANAKSASVMTNTIRTPYVEANTTTFKIYGGTSALTAGTYVLYYQVLGT